jgi:hypothetical protein
MSSLIAVPDTDGGPVCDGDGDRLDVEDVFTGGKDLSVSTLLAGAKLLKTRIARITHRFRS